MLGPSLAAAIAPTIVGTAIVSGGWQAGYWLLAGLTVTMLPCLLFLHEPIATAPVLKPLIASTRPVPPALLLHLLCGFALFSLGIGGLIVHFVPMLTDASVSVASATRMAGLLSIAGIAGRLVGGTLADRYFAPSILAGVALSAAGGCAILAVSGASGAMLAADAVGFSLGAEADLMGYVVSRYYAPRVYGRVFGWVYAAFIVGIGVSPMLLAITYSWTNSYVPALFACTGLLTAAAICFARLPSYPAEI